jgi:hypothetical protein
MACGATEPALEAIRQAMVGPEIVAFVRAHIVTRLTDQIGPRLTMAMLDDLVDKLGVEDENPSGEVQTSVPPPASTPRPIARMRPRPGSSPRVKPRYSVVLVDADRVGRSTLALLAAHGVGRGDVRSHDVPTEELLEAARRALAP